MPQMSSPVLPSLLSSFAEGRGGTLDVEPEGLLLTTEVDTGSSKKEAQSEKESSQFISVDVL